MERRREHLAPLLRGEVAGSARGRGVFEPHPRPPVLARPTPHFGNAARPKSVVGLVFGMTRGKALIRSLTGALAPWRLTTHKAVSPPSNRRKALIGPGFAHPAYFGCFSGCR